MGYQTHYKTFLIGYELPVYKWCDLTTSSFQYHRNKNGKVFKEFNKSKWI